MQAAAHTIGQTVSAKTGAVRGRGGFSLSARAVDALLAGDYRFEREFGMEAGGEVWGVYKGTDAQPSYALDVERTQAGEPVICRCNCPDAACRKRACKHMVLMSVVSGYALRVGGSVLLFASALLASPAALAQAVTERAAAVERAQARQEFVRRETDARAVAKFAVGGRAIYDDGYGRHTVKICGVSLAANGVVYGIDGDCGSLAGVPESGLSALPTIHVGQPCPRCGHPTAVESEPGLRESYLACQNRAGFCVWGLKVSYDYDLMAWVAA